MAGGRIAGAVFPLALGEGQGEDRTWSGLSHSERAGVRAPSSLLGTRYCLPRLIVPLASFWRNMAQ